MILNVIKADYKVGFQINLTFNNGESVLVDLEKVIENDSRRIFEPLRNIEYFKSFEIKFNTISWKNEADFAPEFLLELGKKQESEKAIFA